MGECVVLTPTLNNAVIVDGMIVAEKCQATGNAFEKMPFDILRYDNNPSWMLIIDQKCRGDTIFTQNYFYWDSSNTSYWHLFSLSSTNEFALNDFLSNQRVSQTLSFAQ